MVQADGQRRYVFERVFNFRDLGGYPTGNGQHIRWGKLFRADSIDRLTAAEATLVRDELDVRTIIDLRDGTPEQLGPLVTPPVARHHLTAWDDELRWHLYESPEPICSAFYILIAERFGKLYAQAAQLISESAGATIIHCTIGKDRTGVFSAVILSLLGVPRQTIVEDYALSSLAVGQIQQMMLDEGVPPAFDGRLHLTLAVIPEAIEDLLLQIDDRYGSAAGYLTAHGLSQATIDQLRSSLLTDAGS